jgi:pSer/pThr/pTyr-binding forkhead associated (FHA) protein
MNSTVFEQARDVPAVPLPRMEPRTGLLVISRGPRTGTGYRLHAPVITIGRHDDNDIPLRDTTVSGRHAEIRVEGERYVIVDMGSFIGTYVNRQLVDQVELRDGDEVWIGRHRMLFRHPTRS